MKKSDIKIGTEYAERRGSYGSMQRVRVLGESTTTQGYGYSRKSIAAWRCAVLDARTGRPATKVDSDGVATERIITVPSRQIQEEWAPYAERERAKAQAQRDSEAAAKRGRESRAHTLLDLIPILRHAGLPDIEIQVWDAKSKFLSALDSAGLIGDIVIKRESSDRGEVWGDQYTLKAPLARSIEDYVVRGSEFKISAPDLAMILGVAL
jgi:hypothetical protein